MPVPRDFVSRLGFFRADAYDKALAAWQHVCDAVVAPSPANILPFPKKGPYVVPES